MSRTGTEAYECTLEAVSGEFTNVRITFGANKAMI